jgi:anti-sigma factor RsiW
MNCFDIRPQLEAYALDALDTPTRARVEQHLAACESCRVTATMLRGVVAELPAALSAASPLRPPPSLKKQLMQSVQADVKAHAQTSAMHQVFAPRAALPTPTARRGRWLLNPRVWMFSLATSMLVIVALVGWTLTSNLRMQHALSKAQAVQQKLEEFQTQQALAVPILSSLSAREIVLSAPNSGSDAFGKIVLDANKPTVVFIGYNLPPLPLGQTYVLWTIDRGIMQARGSFTPNRDGFALVVFSADRNDPLLKEVLVTRQMPAEVMPSTDRVLVWRADPNDLLEELSYSSIFPRPTVILPGH